MICTFLICVFSTRAGHARTDVRCPAPAASVLFGRVDWVFFFFFLVYILILIDFSSFLLHFITMFLLSIGGTILRPSVLKTTRVPVPGRRRRTQRQETLAVGRRRTMAATMRTCSCLWSRAAAFWNNRCRNWIRYFHAELRLSKK